MLGEVLVAFGVGVVFFGLLGLAIWRYEEHVKERNRIAAAHNARVEREGYVRWAEARRAGPLDIVA